MFVYVKCWWRCGERKVLINFGELLDSNSRFFIPFKLETVFQGVVTKELSQLFWMHRHAQIDSLQPYL